MDPVLTRSARAIYAIPLCALLALSVVFALAPATRTTPVIAAAFAAGAVVAYLLVTAVDHVLVPDSPTTERVIDATYGIAEFVVIYWPALAIAALLGYWIATSLPL